LENLNLFEEKQIREALKDLKRELESLISRYRPFEKLQEGLTFGIFGRTNAGKSSLFNALLEEDKVIVSEEEGTTRDVVEGRLLNPQGLNILLKDCAGFRESQSEGEQKGQKRSWELFEACDFRLLLLDSSELNVEESLFQEPEKAWLVFTKSDLLEKAESLEKKPKSLKNSCKEELIETLKKKYENLKLPEKIFLVSSLSGEGVSDLRKDMLACGALQNEEFLISNSRHYKALRKMKAVLKNCEKIDFERDIMALELRQGLLALYEILGKQIEDKLLDQIFERFCIGK
ncbi:MAG: 50S ribosome-binding GTPase, partial [Oligoflexia bacterium]|nr:50S ribosome-binding GTPase [Oligoflexia bacterium]